MLDREQFFKEYKVEQEFLYSGLSWEVLEEIYDDYCRRQSDLEACCDAFVDYFLEGMPIPIHSIRTRAKDPKHLIEKIIRKRGKYQNKKYLNINVNNYMDIVQDLVGVRVLILAKEEWEGVFDWIMERFQTKATSEAYLAEPPVAYTRYGDRNIFGDKIYREHTDRGYRSQHYIIRFQKYFCEVQVRTLAEEVYGEFDHRVKYPYRNENHFLLRYTNTVAQLADSIDEIISTCFEMGEQGWECCAQYYSGDTYADWRHISQPGTTERKKEKEPTDSNEETVIDAAAYIHSVLLRKEKQYAK